MLAGKDWLTEEIEKGLFSVLNSLFVTKCDSRNRNCFALKIVKAFVQFEPNLFKLSKVVSLLDFIHNAHDFILFCSCVKDGLFTDFLSLKLIEIVWNTRHQTKLRYQQDFNSTLFLVLNLKQGLLWFLDVDVVLCPVVVKHVDLFTTCEFLSQIFVNDVLDLVVSAVAVVYLNDKILESVSNNVSLVLSIFAFVLLVQFINEIKNCLITDNFSCAINSQEDSFLQAAEIGLKSTVHVEVVNLFLGSDVEIFSCSSNFRVAGLAHGVSEPVVEEEQ